MTIVRENTSTEREKEEVKKKEKVKERERERFEGRKRASLLRDSKAECIDD